MERDLDNDGKRETSAGDGSCHTCHVAAGAAVVGATVILVSGLFLSSVLFVGPIQAGLRASQEAVRDAPTQYEETESVLSKVPSGTKMVWRAAPDVEETSEAPGEELIERLLRCQREQRDLNLMLQTVTQDSRCSLCPGSWVWWRGHCYFFSVGVQENRQWNESAAFCQLHNSSLAVIKDSAEMEFIQGVMMKFPWFPFLWVGLTDSRQEGQWLWLDGMDVQYYMPVTVQWDADHRDCADLRGGGSLFAADCEAYGPWVCERSVLTAHRSTHI